ncbi:MAG: LacI family DNA-binding transcriptional regulator [Candidatus Nanopelagicales bacterium]
MTDLADVAARAGVSQATVSRALRGLPNVSEVTRAKVVRAAEELDYVASPSASRLATGQTKSIAVVMTYVGRPFFSQVLAGAEDVLRRAGYDVLLYALPDDEAREHFFTTMPLRRRVDGVLVITMPLSIEQMARLASLKIPLAAVGMHMEGLASADIDDYAGAKAAVSHLINLGHRRIAMIGGGASEPNPFTTPKARAQGYEDAMKEAGLGVQRGYQVDGEFTIAGGSAAMGRLLGASPMPTAVFCQSDRMAMGALGALRQVGLRCPEQISVVGFGDAEIAASLNLTTVHAPATEQGRLAAELLLSRLAGGAPDARFLPTELVVRASTCPPRGEASA